MSKEGRISHSFVILFIHSFLLFGIALCAIINFLFFQDEQPMIKHLFSSKVMIAFISGYFVFWMVLFPIEIFVFDRIRSKSQLFPKLTIKDLIGLPFGTANPDANIPKWIKIPVLSILFLLLGIFVIFCVMLLLTYLISKAKGV
jgi:hypothetical protein